MSNSPTLIPVEVGRLEGVIFIIDNGRGNSMDNNTSSAVRRILTMAGAASQHLGFGVADRRYGMSMQTRQTRQQYIPTRLSWSKYKPHQGAKECARRVRQMQRGQLDFGQRGS